MRPSCEWDHRPGEHTRSGRRPAVSLVQFLLKPVMQRADGLKEKQANKHIWRCILSRGNQGKICQSTLICRHPPDTPDIAFPERQAITNSRPENSNVTLETKDAIYAAKNCSVPRWKWKRFGPFILQVVHKVVFLMRWPHWHLLVYFAEFYMLIANKARARKWQAKRGL